MTNPAAGWYVNPTNPLEQRYWAGDAWTEEVRPLPPTATPTTSPPNPAAGDYGRGSEWWLDPGAFRNLGRSGQLVIGHAQYLGGWSGFTEKRSGTVLTVDASGIGMKYFRNTFTIPWDQIAGLEVVDPGNASKRITITKLPLLAARVRQDKSTTAVLMVSLVTGEEAMFQINDMTPLELRGKLANVLSLANRARRLSQ